MAKSDAPFAPEGDLRTYTRETFVDPGGRGEGELVVYRKGSGPAVMVITEMPGISPQVLGFADLVIGLGCTAVLPDLFGVAGAKYQALSLPGRLLYTLRSFSHVCISREFTLFATGKSSPVVDVLRRLGAHEHARCGGPGIGVIGMCFTGGFALAMAVDPWVLAPICAQPSLPVALDKSRRFNIDSSPESLRAVAQRCAREDLKVLGLRFRGDDLVSDERFLFLEQTLGSGFVKVELEQADGNPRGPLTHRHSVLTGDLIDRPGEPTHAAREQVLALFREKLLGAPV